MLIRLLQVIESRERTSTSTTLGPVSPRASLRRDAMKISQLVRFLFAMESFINANFISIESY